jgi:hypothetical protein
MKSPKAMAMILVIQASCAAAKPVLMPVRLHGEWNAGIKFCGTGLSDKRLRISANKVRYYESEGTPKAILTQMNGEITVMIEVQEFTGDEVVWSRMDQFALSADGQKLTMRMAADDQTPQINEVLVRCPKK